MIEVVCALPGSGKSRCLMEVIERAREGAKAMRSIAVEGGARVSVRRDPPKKSIRSNVARSDES
jgi:hypothetical protein